MDGLARQRVQEARGGGDERLALSGLHLGDAAIVQGHSADELHVVVAQPHGSLRRLAHKGERLGQEPLVLLARAGPLAQAVGHRAQLVLRRFSKAVFERVDLVHRFAIPTKTLAVSKREQL